MFSMPFFLNSFLYFPSIFIRFSMRSLLVMTALSSLVEVSAHQELIPKKFLLILIFIVSFWKKKKCPNSSLRAHRPKR